MNQSSAHYFLLAAALLFFSGNTAQSQSTPFSAKAEALPFPPDAHDLKFHTTFDLIYFSSSSSLAAVTELLDTHPALRDIDTVELPYRTECYRARLPQASRVR